MKLKTLASAAIFAALTVSAYADTDAKDMKEIKATSKTCASDAGFYVSVFGGANFAQDYGNNRAEVSDPSILPNVSLDLRGTNHDDLGGVGGLKLGYNFESWDIGGDFRIQPAVELEGFYQGTTVNVDYATSINFGGPNGGGVAGNAKGNLHGDLDTAAFFANGIFRLKTGTIVTPYIGAGIGGEYLSLSNVTAGGSVSGSYGTMGGPSGSGSVGASSNLPSEDDVVFAAQALAGVDIEIAKHWDIFTEYKYTVGFNPDFNFGEVVPGTGISAKFDPSTISQQSVNVGVKYNF
jgi:opacity protein-like surface antigen